MTDAKETDAERIYKQCLALEEGALPALAAVARRHLELQRDVEAMPAVRAAIAAQHKIACGSRCDAFTDDAVEAGRPAHHAAVPLLAKIKCSAEESRKQNVLAVGLVCTLGPRVVTERDFPVVAYLTGMSSTTLAGEKDGFVLAFKFAQNPHFSNSVLTAEFHVAAGDVDALGNTKVTGLVASPVKWASKEVNPGILRSRRRGRKGEAKVSEEPIYSFFRLFAAIRDDEGEEGAKGAELRRRYNLCQALRQHLVPSAGMMVAMERGMMLGTDIGELDEEDDEDDE
jgi:hypothetical protein